MEQRNNTLSRKKFLSWGIGVTSLLAIPAFLRIRKNKKDTKTVKMLTQDGQLVMIDVSNIPEKKKHIKTSEIHNWVTKRKKTL